MSLHTRKGFLFLLVVLKRVVKLTIMSIWSMANENEARNNAEKIAELINKSDDILFKKELLPILEKYVKDSNGLYPSKDLYNIIGEINKRDWTY